MDFSIIIALLVIFLWISFFIYDYLHKGVIRKGENPIKTFFVFLVSLCFILAIGYVIYYFLNTYSHLFNFDFKFFIGE